MRNCCSFIEWSASVIHLLTLITVILSFSSPLAFHYHHATTDRVISIDPLNSRLLHLPHHTPFSTPHLPPFTIHHAQHHLSTLPPYHPFPTLISSMQPFPLPNPCITPFPPPSPQLPTIPFSTQLSILSYQTSPPSCPSLPHISTHAIPFQRKEPNTPQCISII